MATIRLETPEAFDFKNPDDWARWKARFEQFRLASGLSTESETRQVSTLLYCIGQDADNVLTSTNISDDDRKKYTSVMAKFEEFFKVRKNTIYERARFNRRDQREGESSEQYITALYELVKNCEYGDLRDEMLRDRLVVGIRDKELSEKLQMDADLTLERAKKKIRQKEAVKEQHVQLRDSNKDNPIVVEGVHSNRPQGRPAGASREISNKSQTGRANPQCSRCGGHKHLATERCPARGAICHRCNRKGHYQSQCFSKTVASCTSEYSLDTAFLGFLDTKRETSWTTTIVINGKEVKFKLDTGAEVTAVSEQTYKSLTGIKLQKPSRVLYGPARQALDVIGQFTEKITHQHRSAQQTVFVVQGLKTYLLGFPAITSLHLLCRVDAAHAEIPVEEHDIRQHFPNLFTGLGNLGEEYQIKLKEGATPYSLYTPRNVPIPLRTKVHDELTRMEQMGVISPVSDPTPWCAGMVVVPKKSGQVRICVDLKPLNENVLREVHPIPKVDETLAQLAGATVFSKLDANSGFWQIPLSEESRLLTTFITPFGRYCFNKLPFGISSAPELFQRRMSAILEGLNGVLCQMDDVLIFGANREEHDSRLAAVLKRIQSAGVTLNPDKCKFRQSSVKFLGHLIDKNGIRADPDKTSAIVEMARPENISDLRRFMGMINQLGKFSSHLAELSQPLRER